MREKQTLEFNFWNIVEVEIDFSKNSIKFMSAFVKYAESLLFLFVMPRN